MCYGHSPVGKNFVQRYWRKNDTIIQRVEAVRNEQIFLISTRKILLVIGIILALYQAIFGHRLGHRALLFINLRIKINHEA